MAFTHQQQLYSIYGEGLAGPLGAALGIFGSAVSAEASIDVGEPSRAKLQGWNFQVFMDEERHSQDPSKGSKVELPGPLQGTS